MSGATHALSASPPRFKEGCWVCVRVAGPSCLDDARRLIVIRAE